MTPTSQQAPIFHTRTRPAILRAITTGLASGTLIVLGITLELATLGYLQFHFDSPWPFSVLFSIATNAAHLCLELSAAPLWLRFWPLFLVAAGLFAARSAYIAGCSEIFS